MTMPVNSRRLGLVVLFILSSLVTLPLTLLVVLGILDLCGLLGPNFPMILDGKDGILFLVLVVVTARFLVGWVALLRRVRGGGLPEPHEG